MFVDSSYILYSQYSLAESIPLLYIHPLMLILFSFDQRNAATAPWKYKAKEIHRADHR